MNRIRKGDTVVITSGREKGRTGKPAQPFTWSADESAAGEAFTAYWKISAIMLRDGMYRPPC